jgi:hypothetical protein
MPLRSLRKRIPATRAPRRATAGVPRSTARLKIARGLPLRGQQPSRTARGAYPANSRSANSGQKTGSRRRCRERKQAPVPDSNRDGSSRGLKGCEAATEPLDLTPVPRQWRFGAASLSLNVRVASIVTRQRWLGAGAEDERLVVLKREGWPRPAPRSGAD